MTRQRVAVPLLPASLLGLVFGWLTPNQVVRVCRRVCTLWALARPHWNCIQSPTTVSLAKLHTVCEPMQVSTVTVTENDDCMDVSLFPRTTTLKLCRLDKPFGGCWQCPGVEKDQLHTLELISADGKDLLQRQTQLRRLVLDISASFDWSFVATLVNLESLVLGVPIFAEDLQGLALLPRLHHLALRFVDDRDIVQAVSKCGTLRSFHIVLEAFENSVNEKAILSELGGLRQLEELHVSIHSYKDVDFSCFLCLTELKSLTILGSWHPDGKDGAILLNALPKLELLALPGVAFTDIGSNKLQVIEARSLMAPAWARLTELKEATLYKLYNETFLPHANNFHTFQPASLVKLTILHGAKPRLDMTFISGCRSLQHLHYQSYREFNKEQFELLGGLKELRNLTLKFYRFCRLGRTGCLILGSLPHLQSLSLYCLRDSDVPDFLEHVRVERLVFELIFEGDENVVQSLVQLPGLEKMEIKKWQNGNSQKLEIPPNVEFTVKK